MAFGLSSFTSVLKKDIGSPTKKGVLGVDIGSSPLKVVQLKEMRGVPTLETYGELQLGPYEGVDLGRTTHLPPTKLTEALVDILREAGATGKEVVFALSYNSSFTSTITVPTIEQEKLGAMIPIEARKYIPISLTKVTLDWFPLSVNKADKTTNVLISATYNDALERYESVMRGGGLNVVGSEIEIFSSIRSVLSPKDDVVAVLDSGASSTRMYIVKKGVVGRTHSVLLSGVELTNSLKAVTGGEFKDAEELKRKTGLTGGGDSSVAQALGTTLDRGLRELHTVMSRYETAEGVKIEKVVVSGGNALLSGIRQYAEDMFTRPILLADPFAKVAYPAFLEDTLKEAGPSFAVAVGAALAAFQKTRD